MKKPGDTIAHQNQHHHAIELETDIQTILQKLPDLPPPTEPWFAIHSTTEYQGITHKDETYHITILTGTHLQENWSDPIYTNIIPKPTRYAHPLPSHSQWTIDAHLIHYKNQNWLWVDNITWRIRRPAPIPTIYPNNTTVTLIRPKST